MADMVDMRPTMRTRNFMEAQPFILGYGVTISLVSPIASLYQLCKLNPQVKLSAVGMGSLSARILPHQTVLRVLQMNVISPVKEYLNPWAAFGIIGILQGGVYGHGNIFFANQLKLGKVLSYKGMFRGVAFAGVRDMISQGIPFMLSQEVKRTLLDPIWHTEPGTTASKTKSWVSIIGTSIFATYTSQGFHNLQIIMQSNQKMSYVSAIENAWRVNGVSLLYRGAEARVGLLLIVNVLNELLLKPAWTDLIEVDN